jgi:hypothetical protein
MSKHFQVGEIVIVKRSSRFPEHVGKEVEIARALGPICSAQTGEMYQGYAIRAPDGRMYGARPEDLHKKPPKYRRPRSGSWGECPFKPDGVRL